MEALVTYATIALTLTVTKVNGMIGCHWYHSCQERSSCAYETELQQTA